MKTATNLIVLLLLLFSSQIFSQASIRVDSEKYLQERINSIPNSNKQVLRTLKSDVFNNKESSTKISKTILDNGYLLIEQLYQDWDGSSWVDDWKHTYLYDLNNNKIERLIQHWLNSNWVNHWKDTYTCDVNNNMLMHLEQGWSGSNWTNFRKFAYTYDVNNNMIESLEQNWDGSNWVDYRQF